MIAKLDEKSNYPCDAHVVSLAYLARFSPNLARERLKREVATNDGKCGAGLLTWISELTTAPVLNDQAVENLDSNDVETVRSAVQYLIAYSRKEDELPLWRRYVEWTSTYEGKTELLDKSEPNKWNQNFASSIIGEEIGSALIRGQGWFADPDLIASVLKRCVGDLMCKRLKEDTRASVHPYQLNLPDSVMQSGKIVDEFIGVAQYGTRSLKLFEAKISQFPPGSKFVLPRWYRPANSDERTLEAEVRAILAKHGMSLEIAQQ